MNQKLQFFPAALNGFLQGVYIVLPVCKAPPILFVPACSFRSFADSFLLVAVLPVRFDIQKIFSVKGAPAFGFDVIVDNERIFRFG